MEIHGQHDDRALLDPATHRHLLDLFGGPRAGGAGCFAAVRRNGASEARPSAGPQKALELAQREADYLTAACDELNTLAPQPGEEEALAAKRQAILSSAKLQEDLESAADALSGPVFPDAKLNAVLRRLERQPTFRTLKPIKPRWSAS